MKNIGIDFGSTYTMVSAFENGELKTVQPDSLTYSYPSIVVYDTRREKYYFGAAARGRMGSKNTITFRAFKMLLNQQMSEENLRRRGYDEVNTPEYITELFLRYVIENTLSKIGEDKVGTLVLGAPECWFQSLNTVDARSTLRDICGRMSDLVEQVKITSEPTNAAAFCVWNYKQETDKELDGSVLVIDYGGGTLDTALVTVRQQNGSMQIKPERRSGAGENSNDEVGKAGIAFQEAVARRAISEALNIAPDDIVKDDRFNRFLKAFEEGLLSRTAEIEEIMTELMLDIDGLKEEIFDGPDYGGTPIEINYYQINQTYHEVIYPTLENVLKETTEDLDWEHDDTLHIALVGGFCNFYLVRKQIYDYFHIGTSSGLIRGMIRSEADREKAIAHGTALFANNVLTTCNVAQFSIGTYAEYDDGTIFNQYAINFGEEVEIDKVYFATDSSGDVCPMFASSIDKFLLNFTKNDSTRMVMHPKSVFANKLNAIHHAPIVVIGFSMDDKEKITVHVYNYNQELGEPEAHPAASIQLSTLKNMFENTILKKPGR